MIELTARKIPCHQTVDKDWTHNSGRERLLQMTGSTKRKTIVLLGLVILFTMLVAANLQKLEFQPGMLLPRLEQGQLVAVPIEGPVCFYFSTKIYPYFDSSCPHRSNTVYGVSNIQRC
jgi:hypothetical protein